MTLVVVPITRDLAKKFVKEKHRHVYNKTFVSHKFSIGIVDELTDRLWWYAGRSTRSVEEALVGVCVSGRPVSRILDDGFTIEQTRICTDGTEHACSALAGGARRAAVGMGYRRVITYTQADESGASMRGAGFRQVDELEARPSWAEDSKKRKGRRDDTGSVARVRWEWP